MTKKIDFLELSQYIQLPERLTPIDSWHRHMPFAFVILALLKPKVFVELGSHRGDSYCSFCQGVDHQQLNTRCYAVDTWQGDKHAGFYGDEIYQDLASWHNPRFASFSNLLRMTFDEALQHFADDSVDLLHIDGLHTYDAVKHDFESWLPKMTKRGVVLFHDTNVRHGDFAVWQLWEELAQQYPSFEFSYGWGLGVLAVGSDVPKSVLDFLAFARANQKQVEQFFFTQGNGIALHKQQLEQERLQQQVQQIQQQAQQTQHLLAETTALKNQTQIQLELTEKELQSTDLQRQQLVNELAELAQFKESEKEQALQLAQQRILDLQSSFNVLQEKSQLVLNSTPWRLRNRLMRLAQQPQRVIEAKELEYSVSEQWQAPQLLPKISIIIPVYRGIEDTQQCIESVLASDYSAAAEVIVINDASPQPELVAWLEANQHRYTLLQNEQNLGFVGTVNRGMALYPDNDVVLVNSDTEVVNDWLDRLQAAAYRAKNIGSVTPFSNNATICSYPKFCQDNELPEGISLTALDTLFSEVNAGRMVDIPTAVGFCMFIRRDCLDDSGLFDADLFGKGYGEENEFCMRSAARGWRHVFTGDTFVYHKGGVSFAETQSEHQRHGHKVLTRLYPNYDLVVQQHIAQDPAASMRFAMDVALARYNQKPTVVFINHARGGGTARHMQELADALKPTANVFLLQPSPTGAEVMLQCLSVPDQTALSFALATDLNLLEVTFQQLRVGRIHYHHSIGVPEPLLYWPQRLHCPYDVTIHDYYLACPQVTMADSQGNYCGAPDELGCNQCLEERPAPGTEDIAQWRQFGGRWLQGAERVFVPSLDTLTRVQRYYPDANYIFAEHQPELRLPEQLTLNPLQPTFKVAVLGALSVFKGADVLEAAALQAKKLGLPLEFHLFGFAYRQLHATPASPLVVHGPYNDGELQGLLAKHQPNLVWFPGNCPETYSYTLSEALEAGLPVLASAIGAFPERLANRSWSFLLPVNSSVTDDLDAIMSIREQLKNAQQTDVIVSDASAALPDFNYSEDYVQGVNLGDYKTYEWKDLTAGWAQLTSAAEPLQLMGIKSPLARKIVLWTLHRPWLQGVYARVPHSVRQKAKKILTGKH